VKLVRRERVRQLTAYGPVDFDLDAIGAVFVVFNILEWTANPMSILLRLAAADTFARVYSGNADLNRGVNLWNFGFNAVGGVLRVNAPAAGTLRFNIDFYDEPGTPFGCVPIFGRADTLAAGATLGLGATALGPVFRNFQLTVQCQRQCEVRITGGEQWLALNTARRLLKSTLTTGEFLLSSLLPPMQEFGIDLVNDDGVNTNDIRTIVWGYFG